MVLKLFSKLSKQMLFDNQVNKKMMLLIDDFDDDAEILDLIEML